MFYVLQRVTVIHLCYSRERVYFIQSKQFIIAMKREDKARGYVAYVFYFLNDTHLR